MRTSNNRGYANRGKKLEMLLEMTHNQYRNGQYADIRKIHPPVDILKVTGNKVEGKLARANWVDYSGIFKGKAIVFDAKESTIERWPLKNITDSQYELLKSWHKHGAIAFLLIAFWLPKKNEPEIYILSFEQLGLAWMVQENGGAKSIPISYFRERCIRVKSSGKYTVDYLSSMVL